MTTEDILMEACEPDTGLINLGKYDHDVLRELLAKAHQAGIDEAWSKVDYWIKHRGTCAVEFEAGECDCGLAETVKALTDNK